jgi:hypothetical protein
VNQFFGCIYIELNKELKATLNENSDRYSTDLFIKPKVFTQTKLVKTNNHMKDSSDHNITLTEAILYIIVCGLILFICLIVIIGIIRLIKYKAFELFFFEKTLLNFSET